MNHIKKIIGSKAQYLGVKKLSKNWKPLKQHEKFGPLQAADWLAIDPVKYWEANNALRFADTISVRFLHTIPDPESVGLVKNIKGTTFPVHTYEKHYKARNGASIRAMYVHGSKMQVRGGTTLKFSVPKLVQGNNFQLIPAGTDVIALIDEGLHPIFDQLDMPAYSVAQGEIRKLHISYNFHVGKHVYRYLSYIGTQRYPKRTRGPYNNRRNQLAGEDKENNGFSFDSKSKTVRTVLYAKGEECGNPLADEVLRLERQLEDPRNLIALFRRQDSRFKRQRPRVIDLTTNFCQRVLYEDLTILRLNNEIMQVKYMWDILREKGFSASMANRLLGFFHLEHAYPGFDTRGLHVVSGLSEPTIREFRRKLRKAGVSYMLDEDMTQPITLPPLTLDDLDDFSPQADGIAVCGEIIAEDDKNRTSVPHDICLDPPPIPDSDEFLMDVDNAHSVLIEGEEKCPMPEPPPWDLTFIRCPEADLDEHEMSSAHSFLHEQPHAMAVESSWHLAVGNDSLGAEGRIEGTTSFVKKITSSS